MTTILSGCGGGYDVFCAIPQYLKYIDSNFYRSTLNFLRSPYLDGNISSVYGIIIVC